jgi:hypothetical protein
MGSSTKRKPADRLRINKPMESRATATGAGGGVGGGVPQDINNVCPLTIRTKLKRQDISSGTILALKDSALLLVSDLTTEVGTVPATILKTLQTCMGMGINYPTIAVVTDKQGVCYAEFAQ